MRGTSKKAQAISGLIAALILISGGSAIAAQKANAVAAQKEKAVAAQKAKAVAAQKAKAIAAQKAKKKAAQSLAGLASIYSERGTRSASGEIINPKNLVAAHRSLGFGTRVKVTNRRNGRTVVVRIIDRGPFVRGRVIDLSPAAARVLGFKGGLAPVTLSVLEAGKTS